MTSALLTQVVVETISRPDPDALLSQVVVEVLSINAPGTTPISGDVAASFIGTAALSMGTPLSGDAAASVTGTANLDNGATLIAVGLIEVTPRARLSGVVAAPGTGNFFLLF